MAVIALDPLLSIILGLCVASVFAAAAWHKLRERERFAAHLQAYRILPARLLGLGQALAPLEAACAIALAGAAPAAGGGLAAALLVLYAAAMAINLRRGRVLDCGCGGAPLPLSWALVWRNGLLALMALAAALPRSPRALNGDDAWLLVLALATWCVLLAAVNQVLRQVGAVRGAAP